MNLRQLMRATLPTPREMANDVRIVQMRKEVTEIDLPVVVAITRSLPTVLEPVKRERSTFILSVEELGPLSQGDVQVSCDCEYFMFYCEYALNSVGAAEIRYSNGDVPLMTNPGLQPTLCKHLYKLAGVVTRRNW